MGFVNKLNWDHHMHEGTIQIISYSSCFKLLMVVFSFVVLQTVLLLYEVSYAQISSNLKCNVTSKNLFKWMISLIAEKSIIILRFQETGLRLLVKQWNSKWSQIEPLDVSVVNDNGFIFEITENMKYIIRYEKNMKNYCFE